MDWNTFLNSRWVRGGLSVLLVLSLVLALCLSGGRAEIREPEDPLAGEGIREITVMDLGEDNTSREETVPETPGEETTAPEEEAEETTAPEEEAEETTAPEEETEETTAPEEETEETTAPEEETEKPTVSPEQDKGQQSENTQPGDNGPDRDENQDGSGDGSGDAGTSGDGTQIPDVALVFSWRGKNTGQRSKVCTPGSSVTDNVQTIQLSGGGLPYSLSLTGTNAGEGRILRVSYSAQSGEKGSLGTDGNLPMILPEGMTANLYTLTVTALVKGQNLTFTVYLNLSYDVRLQMTCFIGTQEQTVTCESGRTLTMTAIYDDVITDGRLEYQMKLLGSDGEKMTIQTVTCYHSGNGRTEILNASGSTQLLLKDGKTGENTFTVVAVDGEGNRHSFRINIPYRHRGENSIRIETNLQNGSNVINGTRNNLTVKAWSEDGNGNVVSYIGNGTDTRLTVSLDGEEVKDPVSSATSGWEYHLNPENPAVGDTNTHTLYIYAEDAYGNYGELTLTLNGRRNEAGQRIGTATVRVDLTALGLGVVESVSYEVLADEPVSCVVEKAIGGKDLGEPYGSASQSLGWTVNASGSLNSGYYLQSLTTGYTPNALEGSAWPGSTEEEVLQAIDDRFGRGTGLATLWRCIYRNGVNKSAGSGGTIGEFDYTSGSGWLFSVGSVTSYPGQSMSSVYLRDGDVLTLRFTLAYGWDVGGGTIGYGNSVGYCVTAVNGNISIQHRMETVTMEDGSVRHVCHCCGLIEDCAHEHTTWKDLEDGTHVQYCEDCCQAIGDPQEHTWSTGTDTAHTCTQCGAGETHIWKEVEGSNTATCTEKGVKVMCCAICGMEVQTEAEAKGHTYDSTWYYTDANHYRKCSACGEEVSRGTHSYVYSDEWDDYACQICGVLHDWDVECGGQLSMTDATCRQIVYHCDSCGCTLTKQGEFEEYHNYSGGICQYCGKTEPGYVPEAQTDNRRRLQEEDK